MPDNVAPMLDDVPEPDRPGATRSPRDDASGPEDSGPDNSGPDNSGPDNSGPDDSGPDDSGRQSLGRDGSKGDQREADLQERGDGAHAEEIEGDAELRASENKRRDDQTGGK